MAGTSASRSAPQRSSFRNTLWKSGALKSWAGTCDHARGHRHAVTGRIPARNASGLRRAESQSITASPRIMSSVRWSRTPSLTSVTGSAATRPALRRPMKVRNTPIPTAVAERRLGGMAFTMASRTGVTERIRNSTPAQKTMPRATCQGMPRLRIRVKVKKPLTPMPGATAKGRRA